ncbi:hypothetical protein TNCV_2478771 [Trichonephila clavipes]|nr:hypothetical protein TNCV_2478771 [Trichonephila clavipes]
MPSEYPEKQLQWTCPSGIQKQFSQSVVGVVYNNLFYEWDLKSFERFFWLFFIFLSYEVLYVLWSVSVIPACDWSGGVFVGGADSFGEKPVLTYSTNRSNWCEVDRRGPNPCCWEIRILLLVREHVSPTSTSTALPTPAPSKNASVNAGLLKDLLVIIEDIHCIDKQVFCGAFKNSPSALRSASADVDKTYVIFEAYCRLRHSQA